MADKKISQFDDAGSIEPTDVIPVVRDGENKIVVTGSAAAVDAGTGIGDVPVFDDDGGGNPALVVPNTKVKVAGTVYNQLFSDKEDQACTGGVDVTEKDLGTITSGTVTPDPADRPMQKYTNGGAHTLSPHATHKGSFILDITNNGSAGAITLTGWKTIGDVFTTTNGHKFRCHISIGTAGSLISVQAMQ